MNFNDVYAFYNGLGSSSGSTGLPPTALPDSKKTEKWEKDMVDSLEEIGKRQIVENMKFKDFYNMVNGRLNFIDAGIDNLPSRFLKDIKTVREEFSIPTFIKHYDFIGVILNALKGVYKDYKDTFRTESKDEYSENEYIREKSLKLQQFAIEEFNTELTKLLLQSGINPTQTEFSSEEEKNAYIQELESRKQALQPEDIENFLSKNFKVLATEWAENTLEEDSRRWQLDELDLQEFEDYFLTGRFFRHYRIGYDNYKIESWSPLNTFFSEDVDSKYPQKGEFIGRIHFLSPSDIINLCGHRLSATQQEKLSNYFKRDYEGAGSNSINSILDHNFAKTHITPFKNFYDHELLKQYESALGQPLGERTITNQNGEQEVFTDWLPDYQQNDFLGNAFASYMRDDIEVRKDLLQVTEGYFRAYRRIGLLTYEDRYGTVMQEVVTDDLLEDFVKEYNIKKIKTVSLDEIETASKRGKLHEYINTIVFTYHPQIYSFFKINNSNSKLQKDIYFVEPLDFQIKGDSNVYDFELPVTGYIGNAPALKLRPYQQIHNICMNQIWDILEKEIGIFFLMDVRYLLAEYTEDSDTEDALIHMKQLAKDIGFLPVDMGKQNLQGQQPSNSLIRQDMTYGTQVEYRMAVAEKFKMLGLEQIGITPQLLGQPNKYLTSEGVSQGAQASFAQISSLFSKITTARAKDKNVHLAVAQYCQANSKDVTSIYTNSDGDYYYLNIMEEDGELFPLRHLGVVANISQKDLKRLEELRRIFSENNTLTNDLEAFTQLWLSDTTSEVIHIAKEATKRARQEAQEKMQHEQTMIDKQIEAARQDKILDIQNENDQKERDRKNKLEIERLESLGRAVDNNASADGLNFINKTADRALQKEIADKETSLRETEIENKAQADGEQARLKIMELDLKAKQLQQRLKEDNTKRYTSTINKN